MPRVQLPPGCAGFADGDRKFMAERGAGSFVNIDDTDPVGARALQKLRGQDYASAGLVDAGPEKFFVKRGPEGRWCPGCPNNTIYHSWTKSCPACGEGTVPESEMAREKPEGQYMPFGPLPARLPVADSLEILRCCPLGPDVQVVTRMCGERQP